MNTFQKIVTKTGWHGDDILLVVSMASDVPTARVSVVGCISGEANLLEQKNELALEELNSFLRLWPVTPIVLCIDSEEIVSGYVDVDEEQPVSALLGVHVSKSNSFFIEKIRPTESQKIYINVCRKPVAEEVVRRYGKAQKRIIHINLGLPATPFFSDEFALDVAQEYTSQSFDSQGLEWLEKQKKQTKVQRHAFRAAIVGIGLCLLIWSSLNIWEMQMNEKIQESQVLLSSNSKSLELITANRQKIAQQKTILIQAQHPAMQASGHSLLIDQIAVVCPAEISFYACMLPPGKKDWKRLDLEGVPTDGLLKGFAKDASELTRFIEALQKLEAVQNLKLLKGDFDRKADHYPFTLTFDLI